jgi:carboxymethylenebutenolidase
LTEGVKRQALRLAQEGFVVLVADLYRGETPRTVKEAERLERELPKARVVGDLKAAVDYLSDRADVRPATLGVVGFGLGGGYALEAALNDRRLLAVAACYSPLPSDPKHLAPLKATVLCILAGQDKSVTTETIEPFRKAMTGAGKTIEAIRVYGKCSHGFLDSAEWPVYGEPRLEDVVDAWKLIARYLDKQLN